MGDDAKQGQCNAGGALTFGPVWVIGWLFTIGFVHLSWWKAILGILVWPYFLGAGLR